MSKKTTIDGFKNAIAAGVGFCFLLIGFSACGSKLTHDRVIKRPTGHGDDASGNHPGANQIEQKIDFSLVEFTDIESGKVVNMRSYMEAHDLKFMLLTFGSRACSACNEKATHLRDEVIGKHPLYLTDQGHHFEVLGINTDTDSRQRIQAFTKSFPFIKWSDPTGAKMLNFFMPGGRAFGIPLTVMINAEGIVWRILNDRHVEAAEMMTMVVDSINKLTDKPIVQPTDTPTSEPTVSPTVAPTKTPLPPASALDFENPGRLRAVKVQDCKGESADLLSLMDSRDVYFVHVDKGECDEICTANRAQLRKVAETCNRAETTPSCGVTLLTTAAELSPSECAAGLFVKGGSEFYSSYDTHFNWDRFVASDDLLEPFKILPTAGPITFGFNKSGHLFFSKYGALGPNEIAASMQAGKFDQNATNVGFKFLLEDIGEVVLKDVLPRSRFTIFNSYTNGCLGCMEEQARWMESGGLKDYCDQNPSVCQLYLISTDESFTGAPFPDFLRDEVIVKLRERGVTIKAGVEPLESDERHFFHDYIYSNFGGQLDPSTVIYDQEGKIVGMVVTPAKVKPDVPEEVLKKVKELYEASK